MDVIFLLFFRKLRFFAVSSNLSVLLMVQIALASKANM
jgi:hypothetical protein